MLHRERVRRRQEGGLAPGADGAGLTSHLRNQGAIDLVKDQGIYWLECQEIPATGRSTAGWPLCPTRPVQNAVQAEPAPPEADPTAPRAEAEATGTSGVGLPAGGAAEAAVAWALAARDQLLGPGLAAVDLVSETCADAGAGIKGASLRKQTSTKYPCCGPLSAL